MLTVKDRVKVGMVWFRSGHFYNFFYNNFQNDPIPMIIMLNYVYGTHPNTGHKHQYIQGINLSYINRNERRKFVETWMKVFERNNGNVKLTWSMVVKRFPYLTIAVRRYLVVNNLMKYAKEIKLEDVESEVISTWTRDYSRMALKQLAIISDRMRTDRSRNTRNQFAKSLSKYLYKRGAAR